MNSNTKILTTRSIAAAVLFVGSFSGARAQNVPAFIAPGPVAPKITSPEGAKETQWANAENFGTIPARLRAEAVKDCLGMSSEHKAVGYHPDALDRNGKLIPGGGILCLTQQTIDEISKAKK